MRTRHSPLIFKNGLRLRNRIVVPPMASQKASDAGDVTAETLAHYARLAEARPGLLIVEYTFIHSSGKSEDRQLGVDSDDKIQGLRTLASTIRSTGAVAGLQITHSGGKSDRVLTGGRLMGPSGIAVPVKDMQLETPDVMSRDDIALWKSSFLAAADRAVHAGFDLLELHSAHGYGLNQWISPITNTRDDEYGGDFTGRLRLLIEIVTAIRSAHPSLLLSVRMPGQDFLPGGLTKDDAVAIAGALELAGVDLIHVSSGIGGWRRPAPRIGEGYLVEEAAYIQARVGLPVIGVGGIETARYIDESLCRGLFQLAAIGRAILKGPADWHASQMMTCESRLV